MHVPRERQIAVAGLDDLFPELRDMYEGDVVERIRNSGVSLGNGRSRQAAAQINLTPRLFISGGYSTVRVQRSHGFYSDDQYKQGQYIFGNIFYSITPRCKVAGEYLYGSRKDMSNDKGHANRVNVMLQYSF